MTSDIWYLVGMFIGLLAIGLGGYGILMALMTHNLLWLLVAIPMCFVIGTASI